MKHAVYTLHTSHKSSGWLRYTHKAPVITTQKRCCSVMVHPNSTHTLLPQPPPPPPPEVKWVTHQAPPVAQRLRQSRPNRPVYPRGLILPRRATLSHLCEGSPSPPWPNPQRPLRPPTPCLPQYFPRQNHRYLLGRSSFQNWMSARPCPAT